MSDEKEDTNDDVPELELTDEEREQILLDRELEAAQEAAAAEDEAARQRFESGEVLSESFMDRVSSRLDEEHRLDEAARQTRAFQEFFTLTAQVNEAGQDLAIKRAVLDVENGEVTVTYRTRPAPVSVADGGVSLDETPVEPEAQAA